MKKTMLATLVTSVMLSGCFLDSDDPAPAPPTPTKSVQAFDPAVRGMDAVVTCDDGSVTRPGKSGQDGKVAVTGTFVEKPETCSVTFTGADGAVDVSNGKDMSRAAYTAPKGLFAKGEEAAATPFSTLIAKELGDEAYDEQKALEVFEKLGLSDIVNSTGSVQALLQNPEAVINALPAAQKAKALATTTVLSDALVAQGGKSVAEIANVAKVTAEDVVNKNPNYPTSPQGGLIYVDLTESFAKEDVFNAAANADSAADLPSEVTDAVDNPSDGKPVEPPKPPTGGTGGTGGDGGAGSNDS
ncbi:hypothetical protein [Thaumasiovibrio subtropicus]|uniref:hypothetical protein n=1 Tax=Thaumasiovibrio subtropicus TaxID=1891207 RepID=UPI000B364A78|nr:hypothetical protein [Thaumasiovibrio subtropicus]